MITLLGENSFGSPPTVEQLAEWADMFGIHHPVVADEYWDVTVRYTGFSFGLPTMHQMAPGMEILRRNTYVNENQIAAALP